MPEVTASGERLDQWKGIAAYLGKDVSTVIRWAKENGLPVHRVPGKQKRRPVFAYRGEIDAWMGSSRSGGGSAASVEDFAPDPPLFPQPAPAETPKLPGGFPETEQPAPEAGRPSRRRAIPFWIVTALAVAAGVLIVLHSLEAGHYRNAGESFVMSEGFPIEGTLVASHGQLYFGAWHGGRIVLFSVPENGGAPHELPVPFVQSQPQDVSADGQRLLVLAGTGQEKERQLWWVSLTGGEPSRIGEFLCHAAALSPDGSTLVYARGNSVYATSDHGSTSHLLYSFTALPKVLRWSLDSKRILVLVSDSTERSTVWKLSLSAGGSIDLESVAPITRLSRRFSAMSPVLNERDEIFLGGDNSDPFVYLLKSPRFSWLSTTTLERFATTALGVSDIALDRERHTIYFNRGTPQRDELDVYDPRSRDTHPFMPGVSARDVTFSRDGRHMAYVTDPGTPSKTLWIAQADGSNAREIDTRGIDAIVLPRWSPDGQLLAFMGRRAAEPYRIYVTSISGGEPREVSRSTDNQGAPTWAPDGRTLIYGRVLCQEENSCAIFRVDLSTGRVTMIEGSEGLSTARYSPDGRYIAALGTDTRQLFLMDQSTGKWRKLADGINGNDLAWAPDSLSVYASRPGGDHAAILRVSLSGEVNEVLDLNPWTRLTGRVDTWFAVAPDGSLIFVRLLTESEIIAVHYDAP